MNIRQKGVTMVELIVTVGVIAIIAAVAAPSFTLMFGQQRLKGAGSDLYGDLQYARSEAVQRNNNVALTFNTSSSPWCYIVHTVVAGTTCTCGASTGTCTGTAVNLKNVSGSDFSGVTVALSTGTTVTFTASQGIITGPAVNITFTGIESKQIQNQVNLLGRVSLCSPGGTLGGYTSC